MRIAIALTKGEDRVYPGPFGHAPRLAIYQVEGGEARLLEIRPNPYAALHGEGKHEKMRELLKDVDLKVGARFGHGGGLGAFPVAGRREVPPVGLKEVLALLLAQSTA